MASRTIALGPYRECHKGVHGALLNQPPPEVTYTHETVQHHFLWPGRDAGRPIRSADIGEVVRFGPQAQLVHAVRWPVVGCRAWVTDMDDFMYPVFAGRYAFSREFRETDSRQVTRSRFYAEALRRRIDNMLWAFAHPSCKGILFRSQRERARVGRWLAQLAPASVCDPIVEKSRVVYPANVPLPTPAVDAKWRSTTPLRVVFCGRHFAQKNGAMALRIFTRLSRLPIGLQCTYIGDIPDAAAVGLAEAAGVRCVGEIARTQVLDLFASAHVLFHPSQSESVGTVFLEAAAAALAVITARGEGMRAVDELFDAGRGALLVERSGLTSDEEESAFEAALRLAAADPLTIRTQALWNHRSVSDGSLSIAARDRELTSVYQQMYDSPVDSGVDLDDLPHRGGAISTYTEPELAALIAEFVRAERLPSFFTRISMDL